MAFHHPDDGFTDRATSYKPIIDDNAREIDSGRSVSLSTFPADDPPKLQKAPLKSRYNGWWIFDSLCLLTSIACFVVIMILLSIYNRRPLESWTFYFSLNTVVSTLGTIGRSSLVAAVSSSLAQGKWIWFKKRRSSLTDFELIDSASRGPWGSMRLLWRANVRHLVSLGALVTILSLAAGPLLQSAIAYPDGPTFLKSSATSIGLAPSLDGGMLFPNHIFKIAEIEEVGNAYGLSTSTPDFGIVAAVNNGLVGSLSASSPLRSCSTGNCTFPIFASMAVCTTCHDVSNLLNKSTGNDYHYFGDALDALGNGDLPGVRDSGTRYDFPTSTKPFHINNLDGKVSDVAGLGEYMTAKGFTMPNDTVTLKDFQSLLFSITMLRADDGYRNAKIAWKDASVTATECGLYLCVNAYNSSVVKGSLQETVVSSWAVKEPFSWLPAANQPPGVSLMNKTDPMLGTPEWSPIGLEEPGRYVSRTDFQLTIPPDEARRLNLTQFRFNATQRFLSSTTAYLATLLPGKKYDTNSRFMGQVIARSGQIQYTHNILQPLFESTNVIETFEQLAHSLTTRLRTLNSSSEQPGTVKIWTTFFQIRWGFLVLPLGIIVAGCIFMFASMIESRRRKIEPWKSNELATLAYGLDEKTRVQLRRVFVGGDVDEETARIRVQLLDGENGMELR